jgi:hypothetical protein
MLQTLTTPIVPASDFDDASKHLGVVQARTDFHAFRKVMRPKMVWGWWVELLCLELQQQPRSSRSGRIDGRPSRPSSNGPKRLGVAQPFWCVGSGSGSCHSAPAQERRC